MRDTGCPAAKQLFCHIWNIGAADGLFQHVQGEPFALFHADLVETVFIIKMLSVIVIERTAQTQTLAAVDDNALYEKIMETFYQEVE